MIVWPWVRVSIGAAAFVMSELALGGKSVITGKRPSPNP
jgi:hypothetical protein